MHSRRFLLAPLATGFLGLTLCFTGTGFAQTTPLKSKVELTAEGGVTFKTPSWSETGPRKADVAVLKNDKQKGQNSALLLLISVEKGPKKTPDWDTIRTNIVQAAEQNKASLRLTLKDDFSRVNGVAGKRMEGSLLIAGSESATLSVEIVVLHKEGRVATVSLVRSISQESGNDLVGNVAASAVFGPQR